MNMRLTNRHIFKFRKAWLVVVFLTVLLPVVFTSGCHTAMPNSLAVHNSTKWEKDIAAFEANDRTNPPPDGCIVFVGSSSIKRWTSLAADFPGLPVINRGFGGSQLADSVNFSDRIITRYHPRTIVIYAGGNDINAGKEPEVVFGDLVALVQKIRAGTPKAHICYISIGTSPSRWNQVEKVKRVNDLIKAYCRRHRVDFIDVFPLMLGPDGQPRPDIFVEDRLHMNEKGYALWKTAVLPYLRGN